MSTTTYAEQWACVPRNQETVKGGIMMAEKRIRARVVEIVQYETNPRTGESLGFGLTNIEIGVNSIQSIKEYAYIRHDQDRYDKKDVLLHIDYLKKEYEFIVRSFNENPDGFKERPEAVDISCEEYVSKNQYVFEGELKPPHWHIVIRGKDAIYIDSLAKAFGVPCNSVQIAKGRNQWEEKLLYLTHEDQKQQDLGKFLYPDSDINANFDFRSYINDYKENKKDYGFNISKKDRILIEVMNGRLTPEQVREKYPVEYSRHSNAIERMWNDYINHAPMPSTRINFYVEGSSGYGKDTLCNALARNLCPDLSADRVIFRVGENKVTFDGYSGQPVIIWEDIRSNELLARYDRGFIFNIFTALPDPSASRVHVMRDSVRLINKFNIINSVQPYKEFLDGLMGAYHDACGDQIGDEMHQRSQSYRRFPFIIKINADDIAFLANRGYIDGNRELYTQYFEFLRLKGSITQITADCLNNPDLRIKLEDQLIHPAVKQITAMISQKEDSKLSEPEIIEKFKDYGQIIDDSDDGFIECDQLSLPF